MPSRALATPWLIIAFVFLWNSGFIGAEYALPNLAPFTLLFWRYVALTALLLAYLGLRRRRLRVSGRAAGRMALVGALAHGVWLGSVLVAIDQGVPAGIVALVVALQPLTTAAFAGWVTGEPARPRQWLGLVLGLAGVAMVVGVRLRGGGDVPAAAYFAPFASVVAITVASLLQRRWELRDPGWGAPVDVQLLYQSAATAAVMLPPAALLEGFAAAWPLHTVAAMAWLIVAVSLGAYALMWILLARLDATRVASLFYLGPPVTMLMAWIAFRDIVTAMDVVGMAVTAAGVIIVQRGR